jgi:membrane protein DedA with SNARE-associated domain
MEDDVIPQTLESWIFIALACFIGFMIGRWIHHKRGKRTSEHSLIYPTEATQQRKRVSKKERRKGHRLLK